MLGLGVGKAVLEVDIGNKVGVNLIAEVDAKAGSIVTVGAGEGLDVGEPANGCSRLLLHAVKI